jgi:hypothetical protein
MLPTPQIIIRLQEQHKKDADAKLQLLSDEGIDLSLIPTEELERGSGEVLDMHLQWARYMRSRSGSTAAFELEDTLAAILQWRDETAKVLQMAPAVLMGDHVAKKIAYTRARSEEAIVAAGVRITDFGGLLARIEAVSSKYRGQSPSTPADDRVAVALPETFRPAGKWEHAVLNVKKGTAVVLWKAYVERHRKGETLEQMAMFPVGNKSAVQVGTVLGHVWTALLFGEQVELRRLAGECEATQPLSVPSRQDFETFEGIAAKLSIDFNSPDLFEYAMVKNIAGEILGDVVDKDSKSRTAEESRQMSLWLTRIRWFLYLKVARVPIESLDAPAGQLFKRARVN